MSAKNGVTASPQRRRWHARKTISRKRQRVRKLKKAKKKYVEEGELVFHWCTRMVKGAPLNGMAANIKELGKTREDGS